jgi:hypothetical protein
LNCRLLCAIIPNYHSISDFRKNRIHRGLKNLVQTLCFFPDADLIGCKIIAIDGKQKAERTTARKRTSIKKKIDEGRARKRTKTTK